MDRSSRSKPREKPQGSPPSITKDDAKPTEASDEERERRDAERAEAQHRTPSQQKKPRESESATKKPKPKRFRSPSPSSSSSGSSSTSEETKRRRARRRKQRARKPSPDPLRDVPLPKMDPELMKIFHEYAAITTDMIDNLRKHQLTDIETFHAVGRSEELATDKLATLAGLHIGQDGDTEKVNPSHTVPAAQLQLAWMTVHGRFKTTKGDEEEWLTPDEANRFANRIRAITKLAFPLYWLADRGTQARIARNFQHAKYEVDKLDKVRCSTIDPRDPLAQANAPTGLTMKFTAAGITTQQIKENLSFQRWCRAVWLYTLTTFYVLTALYSSEDRQFIELGHCFELLAAIEQFVINAPYDQRLPYTQAQLNYTNFLAELYAIMRDEGATWSEAFIRVRWSLQQKFAYLPFSIKELTAGVTKKEKKQKGAGDGGRDRDRDRDRQAPKQKPKGAKGGRDAGNGKKKKQRAPVTEEDIDENLFKKMNGKPFYTHYDGTAFCLDWNMGKDCKCGGKRLHWCNGVNCPDRDNCTGSHNHKPK